MGSTVNCRKLRVEVELQMNGRRTKKRSNAREEPSSGTEAQLRLDAPDYSIRINRVDFATRMPGSNSSTMIYQLCAVIQSLNLSIVLLCKMEMTLEPTSRLLC